MFNIRRGQYHQNTIRYRQMEYLEARDADIFFRSRGYPIIWKQFSGLDWSGKSLLTRKSGNSSKCPKYDTPDVIEKK